MFLFYICSKALVLENADLLGEFHMLSLDDTGKTDNVLVKVNMRDDITEQWFFNLEGVTALPHPIIEAATPIPPNALQMLQAAPTEAAQGQKAPSVNTLASLPPTTTVHDLMAAISERHDGKGFRTRIF